MGTPLQEGAQQPPAAGSGAMSADEQREVARSIGLGGIKYAPGPVYRRDPTVTDEPQTVTDEPRAVTEEPRAITDEPGPLQMSPSVTDEPVRYR